MSKYSEQFKLAVAEQYLSGTLGYQQVGEEHHLDHFTVRRWVKLHEAHGTDGLTKKFSHYSAEVKLSVLQHMWDGDLSFRQAAAVFNIRNASNISHWENCYHNGGLDAHTPIDRAARIAFGSRWPYPRRIGRRGKSFTHGGGLPKKVRCLGSSLRSIALVRERSDTQHRIS